MRALEISPFSTEPPLYWYNGRRITFVERRLSGGRYVVWVQRGDGMESEMMLVSACDVRGLPPLRLFQLLRQLVLPFALNIAALQAIVPPRMKRDYRVYRIDGSAQMSLGLAA
jgi:hypothetical protein